MSRAGMVELQVPDAIIFAPEHEVASFTPEYHPRWRCVLKDGTVAHRPYPPPPGPWVRLGESMVHPGLLERTADGWRDPAGFVYPYGDLPEVASPVPTPNVDGLPCNPDHVQALQSRIHAQDCTWRTDAGQVHLEKHIDEVAALHPHLLKVRPTLYVNHRRLRTVRNGKKPYIRLDSGIEWILHSPTLLAAALGWEHVKHLEPKMGYLTRNAVREYPLELARARADFLRAEFSTVTQLMLNVIWQTFRYRQMGIEKYYGTEFRAYWYRPLVNVLYRAGLLTEEELSRSLQAREPSKDSRLFKHFSTLLAQCVMEHRLFTFEQFGFEDTWPEARRVGSRFPEIIVIGEKESVEPQLLRLGAEFGITTMLLRGQPSVLRTEYLVKELAPHLTRPVRVFAYTDFDPPGWEIPRAFVKQLARYGVAADQPVQHLVVPECFSGTELETWALPLTPSTPGDKTKLNNWLAEGGGIDGQARGIYCNFLQPYERVRSRMQQLLGP